MNNIEKNESSTIKDIDYKIYLHVQVHCDVRMFDHRSLEEIFIELDKEISNMRSSLREKFLAEYPSQSMTRQ